MSGHQSGGVVLTEAERHELHRIDIAVAVEQAVSAVLEDPDGRDVEAERDDLLSVIYAWQGESLAAQAGRVAEVVEKVLGEVADEMPAGTKSDYSIWDGETVCYEGYEKSPNDRRPATWLRGLVRI